MNSLKKCAKYTWETLDGGTKTLFVIFAVSAMIWQILSLTVWHETENTQFLLYSILCIGITMRAARSKLICSAAIADFYHRIFVPLMLSVSYFLYTAVFFACTAFSEAASPLLLTASVLYIIEFFYGWAVMKTEMHFIGLIVATSMFTCVERMVSFSLSELLAFFIPGGFGVCMGINLGIAAVLTALNFIEAARAYKKDKFSRKIFGAEMAAYFK